MRRHPILLPLIAFLAFVSLGLPDGVLGVAWPSIRKTFDLPISQLGSLLATSMVGYLLSSFFAGALVARLGIGHLLVGSSMLVVAGLTGFAVAPAWWVMVACSLFAGLGAGAIDSAINAHAAAAFAPRTVTLLHACYGIGATLGPLLMTAVIAAQLPWRRGYALLAIILAALGVVFLLTSRWWDTTGSEPRATTRRPNTQTPILSALRRPWVLLNITIFFLYTGLEVTAGQWAFSLLTESRRLSPAAAGVWVGMYWGALTAGRIVFGVLAGRLPAATLLITALLGAPVAAALFWLARPHGAALLGLPLLGFCLAPIYPLLISLTPSRVGSAVAPLSIGFQVSAATLGAAAVPGFAGVIARRAGLEILGPFLLIGTLVLLALHLLSARSSRVTESSSPNTDQDSPLPVSL